MATRLKKLLDQMRNTMRRRHYAPRTEDAYCHWIRRFILFHDKQHPRELGGPEVEAFLAHLAVEHKDALICMGSVSAVEPCR
jgi:NAD-dependent SIR2 family protein deacetylase